jgi:ribonuclease HII
MDTEFKPYEQEARACGFQNIAALDEAGRGPLAGPVVAAAVIFPPGFTQSGVADSKRLSRAQREAVIKRIYASATSIGIGIVDPVEIDRINILNATKLAMRFAVESLRPTPDFLLIDGNFYIASNLSQRPIVKGDRFCFSIAAASIVAKVTRDRIMERYHIDFPSFGFASNKGYPTRSHLEILRRIGPCPIHRKTFRGVREFFTLPDPIDIHPIRKATKQPII